jgi:hypothetical protein
MTGALAQTVTIEAVAPGNDQAEDDHDEYEP